MNNMDTFVYDTFLEKINVFSENAFKILLENDDYKKEAQLYHYTSLESLQLIIQNESFRASNIHMMNDPNELTYGFDHICNWFNRDISMRLNSNFGNSSPNRFSSFIFSLSELNDDMHQWEKYGNNHKGIRIGFTPKNLIEYWRKIPRISVNLVPVIYHDYGSNYLEPYGKEFLKLKNDFVSEIENHFVNQELTDTALHQLSFCSSLIASQIKRKEWASEKEWRIICNSNGLFHPNIIGDFYNGNPIAKLENKRKETLAMLTNSGHDGVASKDVLKIGCHAGKKEHVEYVLSLLFKPTVIMQVTQSGIQTR
ncbi:MAG: DUF2971 domain-containing protein [Breznakibacter sp.]